MEWKNLDKRLRDDAGYALNRELAAMVVENEPHAVHYYLTVIGQPIVDHITQTITHRDVYSEYYMFLSAPYDEATYTPSWHKVSLYKGEACMLSTYTSHIATRHFCKQALKERKISESESELLEFADYESLLNYDKASADDTDPEVAHRVRRAFEALSERDQQVIRCLVIECMNSLDAFDELSHLIKPRCPEGVTPDEVKAGWTAKQRQDAMSLLKGRAVKHLIAEYRNQQ